MTTHQEAPSLEQPNEILALTTTRLPQDAYYLSHPIIVNFGSPEQPIYVDEKNVEIDGIQYEEPLLLPIYDAQLSLIQCAVMQVNQSVKVIPDGLAKGFAYYGDLHKDKPVIITYSLEAFFKIAQTGYAVVLVILPNLCQGKITELKSFDLKQIEFVIEQLTRAGYQQLYLPVKPEQLKNQDLQVLTDKGRAKLLDQYKWANDGLFVALDQYDEIEAVTEFFKQSIQPRTEINTSDPLEDDITYLAQLPELQYEQIRIGKAEALAVRASVLDKLVKAKRKELHEQKDSDDFFEQIEAWDHPVNGHDLLNSIEQIINQHIACEAHTRIATALWIVYTWAIDNMHIAPIACITAPEKRCGKTQLLTLIGDLCYKPLPTSNITAAALYRAIEEWGPTLLIDEADTFLKDNDDLKGVINAGHSRKNAYVVRCDGDDNKPTRFNVWCAKAISGIGHLPETIKDRSIILELRRKLPHEKKQRLRHADQKQWLNIKRQCLRWVQDHTQQIKTIRPKLPDQLNDRAQDNWESLFIIAQLASDDWLNKAIHAAMTINGVELDTLSISEQLLTDIRAIFNELGEQKIFSSGLVEALNADAENVWTTWNRGQPMTQSQLASRLKQFGVKSKDVRIGTVVKKGYDFSQFKDAFDRYLSKSDAKSATPLQSNSSKALDGVKETTNHSTVANRKDLNPTSNQSCSSVADKQPSLSKPQKLTETQIADWGWR